jgi:hypothetical protein
MTFDQDVLLDAITTSHFDDQDTGELILLSIVFYSAVVFFQLVNSPVEFDASRRAKVQLNELGIVPVQQQDLIRKVLNAAAWTYVAGTLQTVFSISFSDSAVAATANKPLAKAGWPISTISQKSAR